MKRLHRNKTDHKTNDDIKQLHKSTFELSHQMVLSGDNTLHDANYNNSKISYPVGCCALTTPNILDDEKGSDKPINI